jgi:hypothetical protein
MIRLWKLVPLAALAVLLAPGTAFAGQSVTQSLNPPPPSFETCKTVGNGFICEGARTEPYGATDTGIPCGSGATAFDIFDQGTDYQHAIRYYDTDGNLTRRVIYDHYFSQWTSPLTGAAIPYMQHNTTTDVLAVPGDLTSATETTTGETNFTAPHMGAVLLNAGKVVFNLFDGTLEFSAGPQGFIDYFYNGNTAALAELCTALGAS